MAGPHAHIKGMSLYCRLCNQHSNVPSLRPCHVEQHHREGYLLITRATRKQFVQVCPDAAPLVLLGLKRSPASSTLRRANPEETLWEMLPPLAKIACLCQLVGGTHRTGTSYVQMGQLLPRQELLRRLALRTPTEHYPSTVLRAAQAPQARQSSSTPHLLTAQHSQSYGFAYFLPVREGQIQWEASAGHAECLDQPGQPSDALRPPISLAKSQCSASLPKELDAREVHARECQGREHCQQKSFKMALVKECQAAAARYSQWQVSGDASLELETQSEHLTEGVCGELQGQDVYPGGPRMSILDPPASAKLRLCSLHSSSTPRRSSKTLNLQAGTHSSKGRPCSCQMAE